MSLRTMGNEILAHENIESVFPQTTDRFLLLDDKQPLDNPLFETVHGIIFPAKKLMWPIVRQLDVDGSTIYRRMAVTRSVKDVMYAVDKIYTLVNDERGVWVFVRHEVMSTNDSAIMGFLTLLDDVLVQEYGNVPAVNVVKWISEHVR